jgi:DNA-binding response OmpR family regulator
MPGTSPHFLPVPAYRAREGQLLASDPANSDTRIIMVTAVGDASGPWRSGADAYLTKPFKLYDLKEKVTEVLSQRLEETAALG